MFLNQLRIAITQQLEPLHPLFNSMTLGVSLVVLGIVAIALAAWRYNQVFWQIEREDYQPRRWLVWLLTGMVMVLGVLSIPLLLVQREFRPSDSPRQPLSRYLPKGQAKQFSKLTGALFQRKKGKGVLIKKIGYYYMGRSPKQ